MRYLFVLIFVLATDYAVAGGEFDFKGVSIGKLSTAEEVESRLGIKCGAGVNGMTVCNGFTTIGGESARGHVMIESSGTVARITVSFSERTFDAIESGLIEKFGSPTTNRQSSRNRAGVSFESVTHLWTTPERGIVTVSKNISSAGDAVLIMRSKELVERDQIKAQEKRKDF